MVGAEFFASGRSVEWGSRTGHPPYRTSRSALADEMGELQNSTVATEAGFCIWAVARTVAECNGAESNSRRQRRSAGLGSGVWFQNARFPKRRCHSRVDRASEGAG